ncbi:aminopeptidase [Deinococcus aquiradiocola]|uniref:aminopeptidase n=1 Tax=Deinococcus aquiradiocola TaxID=393059 RepID=UPI00166C4BEF|nr:aminopeptidase [Deinococcus aquiradiocola]
MDGPVKGVWAGRAWRAVAGVALLALGVAALSGCGQVQYLAQAAAGQVDLLWRARPLADVIADPATPEETRRQLRLAQDVREYAVRVLGLPDHRTFATYTDLGRPYLVWNVFVAPPLSTRLRTSCFPITGCVPYRGYFSLQGAQAEAQRLRAAGDDVSVGGVSAYSTLGRLPDPVPSSLLRGGDGSIIRTIIHELTHQVVYVPGDANFNESFAVAVETAGAARYARDRGLPPPDETLARTRFQAVTALLLGTRDELDAVYGSAVPDAEKRERKAAVLALARTRYAALKADWDGYAGYDGWFADGPNGLNNALLGSVAAYADQVPAFLALLDRLNGDFPAFYAAVRACAERPQPERAACLAPPR